MTVKEEKYALYTICDDKFIDPTSVMLFSFLTNNKWFNGDIVILYDVLSHKNKVKLKTIYENIVFNPINEKSYESIMNGVKGVTVPSLLKCYYKYELFNEQKYDVIMWADSDIVFQDSIEELFNDDNVDFCWCEDKGFLGKEIYFNTGFFFFRNIEDVKNNSFYDDIFVFTKNIKILFVLDSVKYFVVDIIKEDQFHVIINLNNKQYNIIPSKCNIKCLTFGSRIPALAK